MINYHNLFNSMAHNPEMEDERPPLTQENGISKVKYAWIVLFNYSINEPEPFSMVPISHFVGSDFPWDSVEGFLSAEFRSKKRSFSNLRGSFYTIFAKVEFGMIFENINCLF